MTLKRVALLVFTLGMAAASAPQVDWDAAQIGTTKIDEGIYMLTGPGGNIGVSAGQDGVLLIDDQYAPLTPKIQAAVASISGEPVRFVVNTHWHGDHTGGNENLGKAGAVIVAHENVRLRLSTEQFQAFFNRRTPPSPKAALPVITFTRDVTFHVNGDDLHVFHVDPAHTDGDSIIHWQKANVFHMGDLYFSNGYPFVDLDSGGNFDGVIAAADKVLDMANGESRIIPGHGPISTKEELRVWRDMLQSLRTRIETPLKDGKTLEEVVASKPTADLDPKWGQAFIKGDAIVQIVYRSLSGAK